MEKGKEEQCQNCRYWYPGNDNRNTECRRHAPIGIDKHNDAKWPEVYPNMWCGDFTPVPTPEAYLLEKPVPSCAECMHCDYDNLFCRKLRLTVLTSPDFCKHFTQVLALETDLPEKPVPSCGDCTHYYTCSVLTSPAFCSRFTRKAEDCGNK